MAMVKRLTDEQQIERMLKRERIVQDNILKPASEIHRLWREAGLMDDDERSESD